jgi:uncharacterized protein (TIGR02284 family)
MMTNQEVQKELDRLYAIAEAGEKGFATAAANVHNRGAKILMKSFAQQRATFKNQILAEIQLLDKNNKPGSSIPGMIHRGRVAIYAAMTIQVEDREMTILKEAVVGERAAVKAYERALEKDLPPEIHLFVQHQFEEVKKVSEQVNLMRGKDGKRQVVRLFENETDADQAVSVLGQNGFPNEAVEKVTLNKSTDLYAGKGVTLLDTILSGAVGGVVWGTLIGILASLGIVQTAIPELVGIPSIPLVWALVFPGTVLLAALLGAFLGYIIGMGIAEGDNYQYQQSASRGEYIVRAVVDEERFREAGKLMDQVDPQPGESQLGVSTQA